MKPINPSLGFYPTRVSRVSDINIEGKSWDSVVFQQSKSLLDFDLNVMQRIMRDGISQVSRTLLKSGFINASTVSLTNSTTFVMQDSKVNVLGSIARIATVVGTNLQNTISITAGSSISNATFVWLELWFQEVIPSNVDETIDGTSVSGSATKKATLVPKYGGEVNDPLTNELLDSSFGAETTRRIQLRWRLRSNTGKDFTNWDSAANGTNPYKGFSAGAASSYAPDATIVAQGGRISGFASGRPFVRADRLSSASTTTVPVFNSVSMADADIAAEGDDRVFIAGNGTAADALLLNTVDGRVYALPIAACYQTTVIDLRNLVSSSATSVNATLVVAGSGTNKVYIGGGDATIYSDDGVGSSNVNLYITPKGTGAIVAGKIWQAARGSASAPTYSWNSDSGTGIYNVSGGGTLGFSISGTSSVTFTSSLNRFQQNISTKGALGAGLLDATSLAYGLQIIGGRARLQKIATPAAPTAVNSSTAGTTVYNYKIVAKDQFGNTTVDSPIVALTNGNATTNNTINWVLVDGASTYDVLRNDASNTAYKLVNSSATSSLVDTTTPAILTNSSAYVVPTRNTTADMIVDGTIYTGDGYLYPVSASVTATGTTQSGAATITSDFNVVTTSADASNISVVLPASTVNRRITILNKSVRAINIFPALGGFIDALAANTSISLPIGAFLEFQAVSGTQWYSSSSIYLSNAQGLPLATAVTGTLPITSGGTGVTAFGTGVQNLLTSGNLTNLSTGSLAVSQGGTNVTTLATGISTFLNYGTTSSLAAAVTGETGTGALVFGSSPTIDTPAITFSNAVGITSSGSTNTSATAITTDINLVTTVAASTGVSLPTATVGRVVRIVNRGANTLNVYPATSGIIDSLAANAAFLLPVNGFVEFLATSTTQWYSSAYVNIANATGTLPILSGGTGVTTFATGVQNLLTSGSLTNLSTGSLAVSQGGTGVTTLATGVSTFLNYGTSSTLSAVMTDETGTGALVFGSSPTIGTPLITYSNAVGITALGSTNTSATAITTDINLVQGVNASTGVSLPTATAGRVVRIVNRGANTLNVYPAVGGYIDGLSINVAFLLPVNGFVEFLATSTTQWYSSAYVNIANATGTLPILSGGTGVTSFAAGVQSLLTSGSLTNLSTGSLAVSQGGTGVTTLATGVSTFLNYGTSSTLSAVMTDETGTGALVFGSSPTIGTPLITYSNAVGITALGSTNTSATAITTDINLVQGVAASTGVSLPTATVGRVVRIVNRGANTLNVYPAASGSIDSLAANAAFLLPVNGIVEFLGVSTTQWYSSAYVTISNATGTLPQSTMPSNMATTGKAIAMAIVFS